MPRGPERQWRRQQPPLTDAHIMASVQGGHVQGFYREVLYTGIETHDRAVELRRSLYRCAKRLGYSMKADIETLSSEQGVTFQIRYRAIDKTVARAWVMKTYGTDRTRWPYNPRTPSPPKEET